NGSSQAPLNWKLCGRSILSSPRFRWMAAYFVRHDEQRLPRGAVARSNKDQTFGSEVARRARFGVA
ncbi:MAG: hypothetical protein L0229_32200, partial [Blastocatellia bacterium]|nr:hypothetical protein [Blastocatellia bacterium]